jgi:hypothetical protein
VSVIVTVLFAEPVQEGDEDREPARDNGNDNLR